MKKKSNKYPAKFKQKIVKEIEEVGNGTLVARKYGLVPNTVNRWVRELKDSNNISICIKDSNLKLIEKENTYLKRLLGEKDLEIAMLKDSLKLN